MHSIALNSFWSVPDSATDDVINKHDVAGVL